MINSSFQPATRSGHPMGIFFKKFLFQIAILIIVIQLSLAASWGWTWLLLWNQMFGEVFLKVATVIGSGLLAGLISRVILKDHLPIIRWLSAQISVICSLVGISYLTRNQVGFHLSMAPATVNNWDGLWQIVIGGLLTLLILNAWSKPRQQYLEYLPDESDLEFMPEYSDPTMITSVQVMPRNQEPPIPARQTPRPRKKPAEGGRNTKTSRQSSETHIMRLQTGTGQTGGHVLRRDPIGNTKNKDVHFPRKTGENTAKPTKRKVISRKNNPIRLMGHEEHRCPYCLETVDVNDPEGVVVCKICHAKHHKRCWDISGTCQVPHIQN